MKALCWYGTNDVRVATVPDPQIQDPGDVVIKITTAAICGSDLHLYDGFMPTMEKGDVDVTKEKVYDRLMELTKGRGPDSCMDAVGTEAHGSGALDAVLDKAKAAVMLGTDRPHVLREVIMCCRKGGTVSIPGVYIGFLDKIPFGAAMNKGLTMKMGQTHVQSYLKPLLKKIEEGEIDPSFVITHRVGLDDVPAAYKTFRDKEDGCIKVVLKP